MDKVNVLIIDDNPGLIGMVKEYYQNHDKINIVFTASNGKEGMEIIKDKHDLFDVVVLDLIMPIADGMYVLEEMKKSNINKQVIVLTSYGSEETIKKVADYDVSFYILKPFELENLENKILSCFDNQADGKSIDIKQNKINVSITKILHNLGMPSHIKGYQYIREGIGILYEKPEMIGGITKELYPEIALRYETTVSRVERAIRHAIEVSWNRGNWELMEEIFGHSVDIDKSKPTNSEFIVTIADKLMLEYHKILL